MAVEDKVLAPATAIKAADDVGHLGMGRDDSIWQRLGVEKSCDVRLGRKTR